jgi:hypothetical protein
MTEEDMSVSRNLIRAAVFGIGLTTSFGAATSTLANASSGSVILIKVEDRCDPATFNAAGIPGGCFPVKSRGTVTFAELGATLNPVDFGHDGWRFTRTDVSMKTTDRLRISYEGGELHSFTKVTAFGRGCVDPLNIPLGLPSADNAAAAGTVCPNDLGTIRPPGAVQDVALPKGTFRFMCVIHPWMRTTVHVE